MFLVDTLIILTSHIRPRHLGEYIDLGVECNHDAREGSGAGDQEVRYRMRDRKCLV